MTGPYGEFPDRKDGGGTPPRTDVPPAEGHGKKCPGCGKGRLVTKQFTSKKDGSPFVKLACDQYPACSYGEFPDRRDGGSGGGKGGADARGGRASKRK